MRKSLKGAKNLGHGLYVATQPIYGKEKYLPRPFGGLARRGKNCEMEENLVPFCYGAANFLGHFKTLLESKYELAFVLVRFQDEFIVKANGGL